MDHINTDLVFCNELILQNIISFMRVCQLKVCRLINHQFHFFATSALSKKAKVTISDCRYNMYKISYEPISWKEYFVSRIQTLKSIPLTNLFVQLRANANSPAGVEQELSSEIAVVSKLNSLHLDIEFRDAANYQNFCHYIFHQNHDVTSVKINFKMASARHTVPIGRMKLKNVSCSSVREVDLVNFPSSKPWDENDTNNLMDFLKMFVSLKKLVVDSSQDVVKGFLDFINRMDEIVFPNLDCLQICLNKGAVPVSLDILRRLQEGSRNLRLCDLSISECPELNDFHELYEVLNAHSGTLKTVKLYVKKLDIGSTFDIALFPSLKVIIA